MHVPRVIRTYVRCCGVPPIWLVLLLLLVVVLVVVMMMIVSGNEGEAIHISQNTNVMRIAIILQN